MRTIYVYDYNGVKLTTTIILVVIMSFAVLGLLFFSPLIKRCINLGYEFISSNKKDTFSDISIVSIVTNCIITFVIYSVLIITFFFTGKALINNKFHWIDTDISTCLTVEGEAQNFSYEKYQSRDIISYECDFVVDHIRFSKFELHDSDNLDLSYLSGDHEIKIYYRTIENNNVVVRIDVIE